MKYLSLKYKLFLFSIVLSIGLTAVISFLEINYHINTYKKDLKRELVRFEESYQYFLSQKIWAMEYDSLTEFIKNEVQEALVDTVKISDIRGDIIAQATSRTSSTNTRERYFTVTYKHNNKETSIGEVYLSGNVPGFLQMFRKRSISLFLVNGLFVTIIYFSSYLILYRHILSRLHDIIKFTNETTSENQSDLFIDPQRNTRPDEISLLINSLNDKTQKISQELCKRIETESILQETNKELSKEIEERTHVELVLKTAQETFLSVLDGIDATIYVADMDTYEVLFMNKYMVKCFGEDFKGEKCWDVFRKKSGPCAHCTNDKLIDKSGKPTGVTVWQGKNPITEKWYINYDRAIEWIDGRLVHLQIATDITDFRKLEGQLQQAQKMEAIGTLAGGIAHDFNNILSAILGYAEMAREDVLPDSTVARDLDKVLEGGNRAKDLVQQILAFSRQDEMERIPLQPASVVNEATKMLRPSLPTTIEINQDIATTTGLVLADPTQIHQILINLCTNAFHAMEDTGGKLDISLKEVTLSIDDLVHEPQVEAGAFVQLSISDSGPGIAPDIKEKIFDPYFTTKETGKGTGMGLAIIHGIVKNHGGFISLYSEPGEGTAFHVFLPVIEKELLPEIEDVEPIPFGRDRILFIDDEEILAEMGKSMLERLGYHVTLRYNSIEALETFQNQPDQFDLIITDQTMPGMTGADIARRMIQIRPDIPIILCTGYSTVISEEKAKSIGIKEFALKPLSKKDIAVLIRKVLDKNAT